jgi:hypothetical protein
VKQPTWKRQRESRIAAGKCVICGKREPRPARLDCRECADRKGAAATSERQERISNGKCVVCGAKAAKGRRKCKLCNTAHNTSCQDRYHLLKKQRKCPRCRNPRVSGVRVHCRSCLLIYARVQRGRVRRDKKCEARLTTWRMVWAHNPERVAKRFERLMMSGKPA